VKVVIQVVGDFNITGSPQVLLLKAGSNETYVIALYSFGLSNSTVALSSAISNSTLRDYPALSFSRINVTLTAGGSNSSALVVATSRFTPNGNYIITVTGTSGSLVHSVTIPLRVDPPPDFTISAYSQSISVLVGSSNSATVSLSSLNGFAGVLNLTAVSSPSNPGASLTLNPPQVTLSPGTTGISILTFSAAPSTTTVTYTVKVAGSNGGITHSIQVTVQVVDFTLKANPTL